MNINNVSHNKYSKSKGKISIDSKISIDKIEDITNLYMPGSINECLKIKEDKTKLYDYTNKSNTVLVVTNGSLIPELGDIGAEASIPFLEAKCALLKKFAGLDAFPICLKTSDVDEMINAISLMSPMFGAIMLESISSPLCFKVEKKLNEICDIPVFNDYDGTAVVLAAALVNSAKLLNKNISHMKIVINNQNTPGISTANHLFNMGFFNITIIDKHDSQINFNKYYSEILNSKINISDDLTKSILGADVYIGFSKEESLTPDMIETMNKEPVVFTLSCLESESNLNKALTNGVSIFGTGICELPNYISNILSSPGILKGILNGKIAKVDNKILESASLAIAGLILPFELNHQRILPNIFDQRISTEVAESVIHSPKI